MKYIAAYRSSVDDKTTTLYFNQIYNKILKVLKYIICTVYGIRKIIYLGLLSNIEYSNKTNIKSNLFKTLSQRFISFLLRAVISIERNIYNNKSFKNHLYTNAIKFPCVCKKNSAI